MPAVSFQSLAEGVTHPINSTSDMGSAHAASREIGGPDGISTCLQIMAYSSEPFISNSSANLLSKYHCRLALGDEAVKSGPEVSFVGRACPLSNARNRLTGTRPGPQSFDVLRASEADGEGPSANTGKEMRLSVFSDISGPDFLNWPVIHVTGWQSFYLNEIFKPPYADPVAVIVIH